MRTDYSASSAATQQVFSMGNGAPFDFFELFDQIVDSSANAYEKLIALVLARHVGKNSEPAFPSRARIMAKASCSLATFKRSQAALAAFFNADPRDGRSTLYAPKPLVTAAEIEIAIRSARASEEAEKKPVKKPTRYPTEPGPGISQTPGSHRAGIPQSREGALTDTLPGIPQIPHNDPSKLPLKKDNNTPPTPEPRAKGVDKRDPFGLNPVRRELHEDVWFDADTRLQVNNGFRVELIALVGGDDALRIELDRAAEWIGPNTPPQVLKAKVRGRLQTQVSERNDRDRRYQKAKQDSNKPPVEKPRNGESGGIWYLNGKPCKDKAEYDYWSHLLSSR